MKTLEERRAEFTELKDNLHASGLSKHENAAYIASVITNSSTIHNQGSYLQEYACPPTFKKQTNC